MKDYSSIRPASNFLNIKSGHITRKLARTIVDFSLDNSFENTEIKLNEHLNLDIYKDKIKDVTYKIASNVKLFYENKLTELLYNISPAKKLEIQIDGVYNPIVVYDKTKKIGEKDRVKIIYKEVKHVMVKIFNDIKGFHFAEIISVENFAEFLKEFKIILKLKGFTEKSKIFVIADGAVWIEKQLSKFFKDNDFYFLIDFYHLSEYIHDAVKSLPSEFNYLIKRWKKEAKKNRLEQIIFHDIISLNLIEKSVEVLKKKNVNVKNSDGKIIRTKIEVMVNLIKDLHKYINNRIGQFNYPFFIKNNMPIGSGRIESANKILIKKRMNIPFGWRLENANLMLRLLTLRHNGHWKQFWEYIAQLENSENNLTLEEVA